MSSRIVRIVAASFIAACMVFASASPALAISKAKKAEVKRIIRAQAKKKGLSTRQIKALMILCKRESGYRPTARNHSCKGLFQLKTHSKKWKDPAWNTRRAIKYIKKRYGTPVKALNHSYRYGWY